MLKRPALGAGLRGAVCVVDCAVGAAAGACVAAGCVSFARRVAFIQMPASRSAGSMPMSSARLVSALPSAECLLMDIFILLFFVVWCAMWHMLRH